MVYANKFFGLYIAFSLLAVTSCDKRKAISDRVEKRFSGDKTKEKAVNFLIRNLEYHYHEKDGKLISDYSSISSELLISNINASFEQSEKFLKKRIIDSASFFEYVLPYTINISKPLDWKRHVLNSMHLNGFTAIKSQGELIDSINRHNLDFVNEFRFGISELKEDTLTYLDIMNTRFGSCSYMTYAAQYYFRSLGIPVANDFVICWANMSGAHMWNSLVLSKDKPAKPFLGLEKPINGYNPFLWFEANNGNSRLNTFKKAAKVFRRTYSAQKNSVAYQNRGLMNLPNHLSDFLVKDVSNEYLKVTTIDPKTNTKLPFPTILLLANYSSRRWIPVAATTSFENYIFKNIGCDVLYNFLSYNKDRYYQVGSPFYIDSLGRTLNLKPSHRKNRLKIGYIKSVESDQAFYAHMNKSTTDVANYKLRRKPKSGKKYSLFYWNEYWQHLRTITCRFDGQLEFLDVPENALLLLLCEGIEEQDDRPFIVLNNRVKWL